MTEYSSTSTGFNPVPNGEHWYGKTNAVMYICTYCNYADNICKCAIQAGEHYFLKITTITDLVIKDIPKTNAKLLEKDIESNDN